MPAELAVGTCENPGPNRPPLSFVDIRLNANDMVVHWRRCALTADYLAGFLTPSLKPQDTHRLELAIIIDELLENAVKFAADDREPVSVTVHHYGDTIRLETSNVCDGRHAQDLEHAIRRVLEGDIEQLFVEQIEASATTDPLSSRLGFITLCMNHRARIGARIEKARDPDRFRVTVEVLLDREREEVASP